MNWELSYRADPRAAAIADRHYNRQSIGSKQFVPPGRCAVFVSSDGKALWVTSWPYAEFVKHDWAGAWVNSYFRNEGSAVLSSVLIREALAATRWIWPDIPERGIVSFVDAEKVRHKRDPGRCYRKAGFTLDGETKGGLLAFVLAPGLFPSAEAPLGADLRL